MTLVLEVDPDTYAAAFDVQPESVANEVVDHVVECVSVSRGAEDGGWSVLRAVLLSGMSGARP